MKRRDLLKGFAAVAATPAVRATLGMLGGIGASAAVAAPASDYRALVCIQLLGGNDGFNWLIPADSTRYGIYAGRRKAIQIQQSQLLSLNTGSDGGSYGLHPACPNIRAMYNSGRACFLANVGTLLQPTTQADFNSGKGLPPQLFSHYDQVNGNFSQYPGQRSRTGWSGRLAELLAAANANQSVPMNISIAGANVLQTGLYQTPFVMKSSGPATFSALSSSSARASAFKAINQQQSADLLTAEYGSDTLGTIDLSATMLSAWNAAPTFKTVFGTDTLSQQMFAVARMISARQTLGVSRQIFFVTLAGFDTHDDQLNRQQQTLAALDTALGSFYAALDEIGAGGSVTSFTMSEFGRSFDPNTDGSDHGWGNVAMIVGGGTRGSSIYGKFPDCSAGSADDTPGGRFIPTSSVDQYGATLSRWFGADSTTLSTVFPNLASFASPDLGFMS